MSSIHSIRNVARQACGVAAGMLLAMLSAIALWQVFSRYVLNSPSTYTEELLRYLMIWMGFLGAAYCFGDGTHLSLTLLEDSISTRSRFMLKLLQSLLVNAGLVAIMIFGGYRYVVANGAQLSPTLGISMSWVYLILPLSGVLMVVFGIAHTASIVDDYRKEAR
ncbi:TRAP transporter small permease [Uliginosibacterium sp. sgz301328]|uniref:TRAP transporter small permease n=1 Tax=Uliginosibacterium sp. sgz301328 TaxID=3243764 RepID=UPI00359D9E01